MMGQKVIISMGQNEGGEVPQDGIFLDMQVVKNIIPISDTNHTDNAVVYSGTEESYSICSADGIG